MADTRSIQDIEDRLQSMQRQLQSVAQAVQQIQGELNAIREEDMPVIGQHLKAILDKVG